MELAFNDINEILVGPNDTISRVIECIQRSKSVACALVYQDDVFINILTDGDVRRSLLEGFGLNDTVTNILNIKKLHGSRSAITLDINTDFEQRRQVFKKYNLRQLVLTEHGKPIAVIDYKSMNFSPRHMDGDYSALIMAGGFGTRLRPLTHDTPKPMLQINGRPMLEINIFALKKHGVKNIFISTHYLPHVIKDYFANGEKFGVNIEYIDEIQPMGTGGALSLIPHEKVADNILIINGDVLTNLDIEMFLAHHLKTDALMTLATTKYEFQVPFGVIKGAGSSIEALEEKPSLSFLVNSGIYLIKKEVLNFLPQEKIFNMTDIVNALIRDKKNIENFPIYERWMDIGRPSDFELASNYF